MMKHGWRIALLDHTRVGEVVALEREIFSLPWGFREYSAFFCQNTALGLGVVKKGGLAGFVTSFNLPGELEILNLAVKSEFRRQKMASSLLEDLLARFQKTRSGGSVFLDVRESNQPAITLYSKFGFEKVGVRKDYYLDTNEDAWIMRLDL
jgi:ribosomal-protein-alanine N-acetyltransferase